MPRSDPDRAFLELLLVPAAEGALGEDNIAPAAAALEALSAYEAALGELEDGGEAAVGEADLVLRRRLFDYFFHSGGALLCQAWVRIGGRPVVARETTRCYFCPNEAQVFRGLPRLGEHARRVVNCPRCGVVADLPWSSDAPHPTLEGYRLRLSSLSAGGASVAVLREAKLRSRRVLTPWPLGAEGSPLDEMDLSPLLEQGTNTWLATLISSGFELFVYRFPLLAPGIAP